METVFRPSDWKKAALLALSGVLLASCVQDGDGQRPATSPAAAAPRAVERTIDLPLRAEGMTGIEIAVANNGSEIVDASADRTGRVVATAHGPERVVRIWDSTGNGGLELRAEIRPPRPAANLKPSAVVGAINQALVGAEGTIQSVSVSSNGRWVAIAGDFGASFGNETFAFVYEIETKSLIRTLRFPGTATRAVRFAADGRTLLVGVADIDLTQAHRGLFAMHGREALQTQQTLPATRHGLLALDTADWSTISSLRTLDTAPWNVQVAADGSALVLTVGGQLLHFRSARNLTTPPRTFGSIDQVTALAYASNGRFAVAVGRGPGDRSDRILALDVASGQITAALGLPEFLPRGGRSVSLSGDMRTAILIGDERLARDPRGRAPAAVFWNLQAGTATIQQLSNLPASAVVAGPDGQALLFGRFEHRTIRLQAGARAGSAQVVTRTANVRQSFAFHASQCARFRVSADGEELDFVANAIDPRRGEAGGPSTPTIQRSARFSIAERRLAIDNARARPTTTFEAPPSRALVELQNGSLLVDGQPVSRAVRIDAVSGTAGNMALIASVQTDEQLLLWDRAARTLRWAARLEAGVSCLNATRDGKYAVALHDDGTVRWYDMRNGAIALTLFATPEPDRWVAWTPSGLFMASPGGADLLGVRVNRRADQLADFFPLSRLGAQFENPDLVLAAFRAGDENAGAQRLASALTGAIPSAATLGTRTRELPSISRLEATPPLVTLLSPVGDLQTADQRVPVRFRVRPPQTEGLADLRVLIDGREVGTLRPPSAANADGEFELSTNVVLPRRDAVVSIVARGRSGLTDTSSFQTRWNGPPDRTRARLFVLAVGVGQYADANISPLRYPAKDVADFVAAFRAQRGVLYEDVVVRALTDRDATRHAVDEGIEWLERNVTDRDVGAIFFAGHGFMLPDNNYYLALHDSQAIDLARTGMRSDRLSDASARLKGRLALLFIDACHAGALGRPMSVAGSRTRGAPQPDPARFINQLARLDGGLVVFMSSTGTQVSQERDDLQNGVFTRAVVEGLGGGADADRNGAIHISELEAFVSRRVGELTEDQQTPTSQKPGTVPDAPLALRRAANAARVLP